MKMMKEKEQTSSQVFALIFALVLSALLASGCSTQAVSGNTVESKQSSYSTCLRVLTAQGQGSRCDTVTSPYGVYTYSRYTSSKTALTSKVGSEQMEAAYETYLQSLDADLLNDLNAEWDALAAAN